jgi:S1-C subfamily serine protease
MTDERKKASGIPVSAYDGILSTDVEKEGGAYAAGLRKGDRIEKVNGVEINSSANYRSR